MFYIHFSHPCTPNLPPYSRQKRYTYSHFACFPLLSWQYDRTLFNSPATFSISWLKQAVTPTPSVPCSTRLPILTSIPTVASTLPSYNGGCLHMTVSQTKRYTPTPRLHRHLRPLDHMSSLDEDKLGAFGPTWNMTTIKRSGNADLNNFCSLCSMM